MRRNVFAQCLDPRHLQADHSYIPQVFVRISTCQAFLDLTVFVIWVCWWFALTILRPLVHCPQLCHGHIDSSILPSNVRGLMSVILTNQQNDIRFIDGEMLFRHCYSTTWLLSLPKQSSSDHPLANFIRQPLGCVEWVFYIWTRQVFHVLNVYHGRLWCTADFRSFDWWHKFLNSMVSTSSLGL